MIRTRSATAVLLVLMAASGCAALVYEVVWLQLLQLVVGSTAASMAVLLGTWMGGMCLGSLALPRVVPRSRHPLRAYAAMELGIGVGGVLIYVVVPAIGALYSALGGGGPVAVPLRILIAALCLLPPTVLMGATLPVVARWVEAGGETVPRVGLFYATNLAGAVVGALLAGFYLLRVFDMLVATLVAAAIDAAVAAGALAVARAAPWPPAEDAPIAPAAAPSASMRARPGRPRPVADPPESTLPSPARWVTPAWGVHLAIALSGAAALGAEVVWTRVLSLILGTTTYTFSAIVAVFLVGLGIGGWVGAAWSRSTARPGVALGSCQLALGAGVAWTAYMLAGSLPYWPMIPWLSPGPWLTMELDLLRAALAVLPPALLWGASFPLALAAAAAAESAPTPDLRAVRDAGRLVARVYGANTLGAILGATAFSLFVIGGLGERRGEQILIGLSLAAGLLLLVPWVLRRRAAGGALALATAAALVVWLGARVAPVPAGVIGYGRFLPYMTNRGLPVFLYTGEGRNSSIAVSVFPDGKLNFHVAGKVEASTDLEDMRLQRLLGHLPALAHGHPRDVLVVGFGAGVTAGAFVTYPDLRRIVIVEIEPLIPQVVGRYFADANHSVLDDPRVEIVYDDARHYLLTTRDSFDVVTSDPIHPWVKGSAALYTEEYFELVRRHLRPDGVVAQWVPLYESSSDVVRSELATFLERFPGGTLWSNHEVSRDDPDSALGYDLVLLARASADAAAAPPLDAASLARETSRPERTLALASLRDVELATPDPGALLRLYLGKGSDLAPWLAGAQVNRDRNLRLQYLAGLALDQHREAAIYDSLAAYRR